MPPARRSAESQPAAGRSRLLRAGLDLARRGGLRALTVRGVAEQAEVNLGSFVYHFGTREAFVAELIEHWYAPLYERLQHAAPLDALPLARLRALVAALVRIAVENHALFADLVLDAFAGEPAARRFLASLAGRHPKLVFEAVAQAQADGEIEGDDPWRATIFIGAAVGAPVLLGALLMRSGALPKAMQTAVKWLALDADAALRRLDWALRGLAARGAGG